MTTTTYKITPVVAFNKAKPRQSVKVDVALLQAGEVI
jgi:hypothetical protein